MIKQVGKVSVETKGFSTEAYKENPLIACGTNSNRKAFQPGAVLC